MFSNVKTKTNSSFVKVTERSNHFCTEFLWRIFVLNSVKHKFFHVSIVKRSIVKQYFIHFQANMNATLRLGRVDMCLNPYQSIIEAKVVNKSKFKCEVLWWSVPGSILLNISVKDLTQMFSPGLFVYTN